MVEGLGDGIIITFTIIITIIAAIGTSRLIVNIDIATGTVPITTGSASLMPHIPTGGDNRLRNHSNDDNFINSRILVRIALTSSREHVWWSIRACRRSCPCYASRLLQELRDSRREASSKSELPPCPRFLTVPRARSHYRRSSRCSLGKQQQFATGRLEPDSQTRHNQVSVCNVAW